MIYNDWHRTMDPMVESVESDHPEGMGLRLLHFRQLVGYSHEATSFLTDARKHYPDIDRFVSMASIVKTSPDPIMEIPQV